jgi:hypothetical protein
MKNLIIDRSKWRTGGDLNELIEKYGDTYLLNDKGNKCCLGFFCEQIGNIDSRILLGVTIPCDINSKFLTDVEILISRGHKDIVYGNSAFAGDAISINDNHLISNEQRERDIIEHFAKIDVNVIFENQYK